jgi:heterodisulfide reductase subunit D
VPGIEIVDLHQPAVGLQSNNLKALPAYRRELDLAELKAPKPPVSMRWLPSIIPIIALCARTNATGRSDPEHVRDRRRQHGLHTTIIQAAQDHAGRRCDPGRLQGPREKHNLDPAATRLAIKAMLAEQPAPLRGA